MEANSKQNLPNFLILGTAKAGTTSLYNYLAQHEQIYMSPLKEPHFFALENEQLDFRSPHFERLSRQLVNDLAAYRALFQQRKQESAIGEASTGYLYVEQAPERIHRIIPNAKLIAVLRNPAERAASQFVFHRRDGLEPLRELGQALDEEKQRIEDKWWYSWHYVQMGFYYQQLSRYFKLFARAQMKIILYEDFANNPSQVLREIFTFLNVRDDFQPDRSLKHNPSGIPRFQLLHKFLKYDNGWKAFVRSYVPRRFTSRLQAQVLRWNLQRPEVAAETHQRLLDIYRADIQALQGLIDRDLSHWLK